MESMRSYESELEKIKELDIGCEDDEDVNENNDILKRRISTHPLYNLLLESHIDCLQACGIGELEIMNESRYLKQQEDKNILGMHSQPELDHFMEAYCFALRKLKEAMEEPQQKSMSFITNMHSQLTELTRSTQAVEPTTSFMVKASNE